MRRRRILGDSGVIVQRQARRRQIVAGVVGQLGNGGRLQRGDGCRIVLVLVSRNAQPQARQRTVLILGVRRCVFFHRRAITRGRSAAVGTDQRRQLASRFLGRWRGRGLLRRVLS